MKKIKLHIIFLSLVFLASCGGGLSEEEKNEIENFEKEWNVNIQMGELLSEKLEMAEKLIFIPSDTISTDSITNLATDLEKFEIEYRIIEKKFDHFNLSLNKEYATWVQFKNKTMKDEMEYDEVSSVIESKRNKMLEFQADISKLIKQADKLLSEIPSK